ncbi:dolichol-phosphate mannosyltransferase subunit 3 [Rhizoctonia solani AG-3 Rhs1AP]|uniref:Dolichol-phosphate mannosyltransferase subunit 3 n=2 Tax=Rhizoctonia solani AG-3 TaxID=1086053 RepID=A0A074RR97_9AGAM|nr:dolichol-phosphate mannosyltransferase subunit 3 [Rhizoctonia solani AG-3 Rhs1AP]KEP49404.1 dolichol-phosphate mannosyltransferase subunit 3 [Rhizoctonia solani 123E]
MTRATRFALAATLVSVVYFLFLYEYLSVPLLSSETSGAILPTLPWWLLVSFGAYSLGSLGWGLYSFRDCTDAYHELLGEINQAKNELRVRGVSVD